MEKIKLIPGNFLYNENSKILVLVTGLNDTSNKDYSRKMPWFSYKVIESQQTKWGEPFKKGEHFHSGWDYTDSFATWMIVSLDQLNSTAFKVLYGK